jgi:WD40 repeat protein
VALWEWRSGTLQRRLEHGRGSTHPAWSPAGATLAVGGGDGTISMWSAATGERLATLSGHDGSVNAVRFSPDGRRLASASADQSACLWDPAGGGPLLCVPFAEQVYSLAWGPDGSRLLTLPLDRELVWLDSVPARDRAAAPVAGDRR